MNAAHAGLRGVRQFLSCLFGSEHVAAAPVQSVAFLSCLFGSELTEGRAAVDRAFLSCLFGSEQ